MFIFLQNNFHELLIKLVQQLYLVGAAIAIALLIGIPMGIFAAHHNRVRHWVLGFASILQTIPGLALLVFLLPFFGIGVVPAIVALSIYALLPIAANTVIGITTIPQENIEAATALGFTAWEQLIFVETPLAMPTIIGGIRIATTICVGTATLAAFIGGGGLGDFINRGLALNNTKFLMLGAIPAAFLALFLDFSLRAIQKNFQNLQKPKRKKSYLIIIMSFILFFPIAVFAFFNASNHTENTIRIGTANFTEQLILGELMAQLIEAKTHLKVERKFNLGTSELLQKSLLDNQIDLYPEYTGTAYLLALHQTYLGMSRQALYSYVKENYLKKYHLIWLSPFGFNDTQAIAVKYEFADRNHLKTISDLLPLENQLTLAAPPEFSQRPDGRVGLIQKYGLHFLSVKEMEPVLMYQAIKNNNVNVMVAFSTDGRVPVYHLHILQDDKNLFPPYDCAPLVRMSVLKLHPEIVNVLQLLSHKINDETMQKLNAEVDLEKRTPKEVAHDFLLKQGLV
jgi:osmoprotectant transport system permease protein